MQPLLATALTALLVARAITNNSLTPAGIVVATLAAIAHAVHPWSVFFALLAVFFLGGSAVTKVKHHQKSQLTLSAAGPSSASAAPEPRSHVQVLANSGVASALILAHAWLVRAGEVRGDCWPGVGAGPAHRAGDVLVVGIVCNYAAVAADTFSSELGILSRARPLLLTALPPRRVPPGTNGAVSALGTAAGALGAFTVAVTSVLLLPFCPMTSSGSDSGRSAIRVVVWVLAVTLWGTLGSLVDSVLGGLVQASVVDVRSGKIVEHAGGRKVSVQAPSASSKKKEPAPQDKKGPGPSRQVVAGFDILDNNGVNALMASLMSVGSMALAGWIFRSGLDS